jgi:hypothetical protein
MELLKKYISEINEELKVNDLNIKEVQMRLPSRKHFWVARLINAKVEKNNLLKDKKRLVKNLVKRIRDESPVTLTPQTAEQMAIKSSEVEEVDVKIKELDVIVEYLEKVEKIFANMHWEIKNIIQINEQERL